MYPGFKIRAWMYKFIFILGGTSSKERLERLLGVFEGHHLAVLSLWV
jgi:hypothetical protein